MPRINGIFQLPPNSYGTPGSPIESAKYNAVIDDIAADQNGARPLTAGGTGANSAAQARTNLGLGTAATKNQGAGSGLDADTVDGKQAAEISAEAVTTVRGGVAAAYDTLKEIYDWAAGQFGTLTTAVAGKVSKTGDTMTGNLKIEAATNALLILNSLAANGHEWRVFSASDGNIAIRDETAGLTLFVITPDGKINIRGQADILSHINTKVPLSGGTMTAPLTILNPNSDVSDVILISRLFPDAGYRLRARNDGFFAIVTREDGLSKFTVNPEGRIWSRAIALMNANEGDLINWVTSQIAAAKAEAMAAPAYGAIRFSGTFAVPDTTAIAPGDNIAGSRLRPAGLYFSNPSATDDLRAAGGVMNIGSTGMAGTWQCKSYFGSASGHRFGEFLRVS